MGLDTDIRNVQKRVYSPSSWLKKEPGQSIASKGVSRIRDALCEYHEKSMVPNFSGRPNGLYTSRQLFDDVVSLIFKRYFIDPLSSVRVYVVSFDDDANPKLKKHNRKKSSKPIIPYEENVQFVDTGIVVQMPIPGTKETRPQTELIDLERLIKSRKIRKRLWSFFLPYMKELVVPEGRALVMSHDKDGPWMFRSDYPGGLFLADYKHDLSETDLCVNFWFYQLRSFDVIVHTVDTDLIPICFSYLSITPEKDHPPNIYWQYKDTSKEDKGTVWYVDMKKLYKETLEQSGMTASEFIAACILCGSDFYDKQVATSQLSDEAIFQAFMLMRKEPGLKTLLDHEEEKVDGTTLREMKDTIQKLFNIVYTLKLAGKNIALPNVPSYVISASGDKKTKVMKRGSGDRMADLKMLPESVGFDSWSVDTIKAEIQKRELKKIAYPTPEAFTVALDQFRVNYLYWMKSWREWHGDSIVRRQLFAQPEIITSHVDEGYTPLALME